MDFKCPMPHAFPFSILLLNENFVNQNIDLMVAADGYKTMSFPPIDTMI